MEEIDFHSKTLVETVVGEEHISRTRKQGLEEEVDGSATKTTDESPESSDDQYIPIDHLSSSNLSQKRKAMEANLFSSPSSDDESPKHQKDVSQEHPMDDGLSSKQIQGTDTTPLKGPKTVESPESPEPSDDESNPIDLVPDLSDLDESSDDESPINNLPSSNCYEPTVIGVRKAMDESQEHPKDESPKPRIYDVPEDDELDESPGNESPINKADLSSSNLCEPTVIGVRKAMDESQEHPKDESPKPRTYRMSSYKVKMVTALRKLLLEQQAKQEARAKRLAIVEEETIEKVDVEENEEDEESEEEENINYGTCDVCCMENVHWAYNCPYLTLIPNPTETKIGPRYDVTCKCHTSMGCHPDPNDKGWEGRAIKKYCGNCTFPDHWYEDCPIRAEMLKKREQKKREQKEKELIPAC